MFDLWNKALFAGLHGSDPFLAQIPLRVQKEGDAAFLGAGEMEYERCSAETSFPMRDAQGVSLDEFFGSAAKLGHDLAREQAKGVFKTLMQPGPHAQPFRFEEPLVFEQLLETWEKMDVRFDTNGKPLWPSIVMSPSVIAAIKERLPKCLEDPMCQRRWNELIAVKRKEFDEREARRRLVD